MELTAGDIATVTGGELLSGDRRTVATSFSFDTRTLEPGACFIAVRSHRDGHDFVADAFARGAAVAIVERAVPGLPASAAVVRVDDAFEALAALGRYAREQTPDVTVVAVTGSAGKTVTKDFAASAHRTRRVHASPGSFNNEIGLPLTLLTAPPGVEVVVVEMGARFPGNIADLCEIARPRVGIVTNVGWAHAEHLGGPAGVARVKGELVEALPESGVAILNADDRATGELAARTSATVLRVGAAPESDLRWADVRLDAELRAEFLLETPWGSSAVCLSARGAHQVANASLAAASALVNGVELHDVVAGLAEVTAVPGRMHLVHAEDGVVILDDAYNASPSSMEAALRGLQALPAAGRRIAVLGAMRELGSYSPLAHEHVGRVAGEVGVDVLIVVGDDASDLALGAGDAGVREVVRVPDAGAAIAAVRGLVVPGDAVLVKASRAVGLEVVVDALLDGGSPE